MPARCALLTVAVPIMADRCQTAETSAQDLCRYRGDRCADTVPLHSTHFSRPHLPTLLLFLLLIFSYLLSILLSVCFLLLPPAVFLSAAEMVYFTPLASPRRASGTAVCFAITVPLAFMLRHYDCRPGMTVGENGCAAALLTTQVSIARTLACLIPCAAHRY